jgi:hypothetical protein
MFHVQWSGRVEPYKAFKAYKESINDYLNQLAYCGGADR